MTSNNSPIIFICAGEASGDILGAQVMNALRERYPNIQFQGVGGPTMEKEGLTSLFPMQDLSVMGIWEILPHLRNILKRLKQTTQAITSIRPPVLITIDSPGFNFRLAKKIRNLLGDEIKIIHYGAPTVWAWRPGRAKKVAKFLDHLLALFPFEPPYFLEHKLPTTFVGHPIATRTITAPKKNLSNLLNILILPGSRRSEILHLGPIFAEVTRKLLREHKNLEFLIPTLPNLKAQLETLFQGLPVKFTTTEQDKWEAFSTADLALAASGTVTLELATAHVPMIVSYKTSSATAWILKRLIKTPYVSLVNILCDKKVIPELLQEQCNSDILFQHMDDYIEHPEKREAQIRYLKKAVELLKTTPAPSEIICNVIKEYIPSP